MASTSVLVVACAFLGHFLTSGWTPAMGVYYVTFLEVFQQSHAVTAWVGSLNYAVLCVIGPFASVLIGRYGCHVTLGLGGLISGCGLVMSAFAQNIYVLYISHGVVTGVGYGLSFASCVVVVNLQCCDRNRSLAMGMSLAGFGSGASMYPFLFHHLESVYGWRGALLISGGVTFQTCLVAMVLWIVAKPGKQNSVVVNDMIIVSSDDAAPSAEDVNEEDREEIVDDENSSVMLEKKWTESVPQVATAQRRPARATTYWHCVHYWLLHVNSVLFCFGQSMVFTHVMAYGESVSLQTSHAAWLISAMAFANIGGRVLLGGIASIPTVNLIGLFSACYILAGLAIFLCTLWAHFAFLLALMLLFGAFSAAYGPVVGEVCCRIVGVENFASAYGALLLSMGAGTLLGAPIAGELYDLTHAYANSMYLGAASFVASGLVVLPSYNAVGRRPEKPENIPRRFKD